MKPFEVPEKWLVPEKDISRWKFIWQAVETGDLSILPVGDGSEDWAAYIRSQRMSGILYGCLNKEGSRSASHENIRKELRDDYIRLQSLRKIRADEADAVLETLRSVAVTPLLMKGLYLQEFVYGRDKARPSSDIDILIENGEDFDRAVKAVAGLGYRKYEYYSSAWERRFMKSTTLIPDSKRLYFEVDLHRSLVYSRNDRRWKFDAVLLSSERQETRDYRGKKVRTLSPEANFLYLAYHALEIHDNCRSLVWLADLIELSKIEGFSGENVRSLAREAGCPGLPEYAFYLMGRLVTGDPGPEAGPKILKGKRGHSSREKFLNVDGFFNKIWWLMLWLFPSGKYLAGYYGPGAGSLTGRMKYLAEKTGIRKPRRQAVLWRNDEN